MEFDMSNDSGRVYCLRVGFLNRFKIGKTRNSAEERRRDLSTGSAEKLVLYREIETEDPAYLERYIHALLDDKRAENGEFFNVAAPELDAALDEAQTFFREYSSTHCRAEALKRKKPDETMIEPSEEMRGVYRGLRALEQQRFLLDERIAVLRDRIKVVIGEKRGINDVASWDWVERSRPDLVRFKAEQPELYARYQRDDSYRVLRLARFDLARNEGQTEGERDAQEQEELLAIAGCAAAHVERPYLDHAELLYDEHGLPE